MTSRYREARFVVLFNMAILALAWGMFFVLPVDVSTADVVLAAIFALLGILSIPTVPAVMRRILTPLPAGTPDADARRLSLGRFAPAVGFGGAAGAVVPYVAALVAARTHNPLTYILPFAIGQLLLYRHVLPRRTMIEAARQRLEADGVTSHLWESLAIGRDSSTPEPST